MLGGALPWPSYAILHSYIFVWQIWLHLIVMWSLAYPQSCLLLLSYFYSAFLAISFFLLSFIFLSSILVHTTLLRFHILSRLHPSSRTNQCCERTGMNCRSSICWYLFGLPWPVSRDFCFCCGSSSADFWDRTYSPQNLCIPLLKLFIAIQWMHFSFIECELERSRGETVWYRRNKPSQLWQVPHPWDAWSW